MELPKVGVGEVAWGQAQNPRVLESYSGGRCGREGPGRQLRLKRSLEMPRE